MKERDRLLAAIETAAPGLPLERVIALLLESADGSPEPAAASGRLLRDPELRVEVRT